MGAAVETGTEVGKLKEDTVHVMIVFLIYQACSVLGWLGIVHFAKNTSGAVPKLRSSTVDFFSAQYHIPNTPTENSALRKYRGFATHFAVHFEGAASLQFSSSAFQKSHHKTPAFQ